MMLEKKHLLLAHDMGLGKTVTTIAACESLIDSGDAESILVVAPASVKWQWKREIERFSDGALVTVIEGSKPERLSQYRAVKRGDFEYVIVNYEQVVNDWDIVRLLGFDVAACDEVVAIKSPGSKRSRHVKRLQTPYRFGLSGQPIENKPEELFSIMEWVDRSVLGRSDIFDQLFIKRDPTTGRVKYYRNLPKLRKRMRESMHRKTRHEVADQMPDVIWKSSYSDLDPAASKVYRVIAEDLIDLIRQAQHFGRFNIFDHYSGVNDGGVQAEIMPRLMALRMLCNHPALLEYSADEFDDPDSKAGSAYISDLRDNGLFDRLRSAPKFEDTIEDMVEILDADPRNKIVLFSFFKPMLALFSERLQKKRIGHEMFTGDYSPRERDEAKLRFSKMGNRRVLLSSDAGGIGVDMPAANYLISYDLPWSAGKYQQRTARIIRISSKWPEVTVINRSVAYSIEERMFQMLEQKGQISSAWIDGKGVDKMGKFELTLGGLADFLEANLDEF